MTVSGRWFVTVHDTTIRDGDEATQDGGAGFGAVVALLAVVGAVLVARRPA